MNTVAILLSAFVVSVVALLVFVWSQGRGFFQRNSQAAEVIFATGEIGTTEEPALSADWRSLLESGQLQPSRLQQVNQEELVSRAQADASSARVVMVFLSCSMFWLLIASAAGLTASLKLHQPDWLAEIAWLTFGRIRTIHLNAVAYGWAPMAGLGIALFIIPRLLKTPLRGSRYAVTGCAFWNLALCSGLIGIGAGFNDGMEWLEIPWQVDTFFVAGGALVGIPLVLTLLNRQVTHLYVSVWYMVCALFWFPVLFLVANFPGVHQGIAQATMNWWYGHNVLGLFYTPLALASIYYFLPKVIGQPIQSYNLSLLGFWGLAFFYGQVGGHHLIGGPVPQWLVTLSIVQSLMMVIPVMSFTVNQYQTLQGRLAALRWSPTLRFVGFGGLMYTFSSIQGSLEALRSVNLVAHFTHYTVGHAHLGLYGFVSMVFFGGIYFIMPRITEKEWPSARLISLHFWCAAIGIALYFLALTIGGWLQGLAMLDEARPFMDSVRVTLPYLRTRSVAGALMVIGHLVFIAHFIWLLMSDTQRSSVSTLLRRT